MVFDIRTIVLVVGAFHIIQVLVFLYQYIVSKKIMGTGWLLLWSLADSVAAVLILLRGIPSLLPIIIIFQNTIIFAGSLFIYIGILRFFEKRVNLKFIFSYFLLYFILHLFFFLVVDDSNIRTLILYAFVSATSFLTAVCIFRNKTHSIALTANVNSIIIVIHGLIYAGRVVMILAGVTSPSMFSPSIINYLMYFDALVVGLCLTFGFIIMLNQRLNSEIVRRIAEKDKFFSIIAHDLKSPFNAFLGMTEIMADDLPDLTMTELQKMASGMRNSARNLFSLLENLLEWSRLEQGLIPHNPEILLLLPLVDETLLHLKDSAQAKEISITNHVTEDIRIKADHKALQTIIRNLLSNSIKFTHRGGNIIIDAKMISDQIVNISIEDTGIGMTSEMLKNLFQLDGQVNRKGTEGESSTGLGLIICNEFIEKHGGEIKVSSDVGKGTIFTISFSSG